MTKIYEADSRLIERLREDLQDRLNRKNDAVEHDYFWAQDEKTSFATAIAVANLAIRHTGFEFGIFHGEIWAFETVQEIRE